MEEVHVAVRKWGEAAGIPERGSTIEAKKKAHDEKSLEGARNAIMAEREREISDHQVCS